MFDSAWNAFIALGAAALSGGLLGLNRQLHRKPAGLRTHALVALGAAVVSWLIMEVGHGAPDAFSRVVQGVITGIGFLGAGVIMHHDAESRVEGLTTAASIWMAAMLGICCGSGRIVEAAVALGMALIILVFGALIERGFVRIFGEKSSDE